MPTFSAHRCFGLKPIFALFLIAVSFLSSCQKPANKELETLVQEWTGKEIIFPDNCKFSYQGVDECAQPSLKAKYKIVAYIDSVGCLSCKLNLSGWQEFMDRLDSINDGNVSLFMYYHPRKKDIKELLFNVRREHFAYPICVDTLDRFNSANLFPTDQRFQVMLADEQNRVLVVGNPILNPAIKSLYESQILGDRGDASNIAYTTAALESESVNFGRIIKGEVNEHSFNLINTGDCELLIKDIIPSCDCIKIGEYEKVVLPGKSCIIPFSLVSNEKGDIDKSLFIYCNTSDSPMEFRINGVIVNSEK